MLETLRRNHKRRIAQLLANATVINAHSENTNFEAREVSLAWFTKEIETMGKNERLTLDKNGETGEETLTLHVHSNLWYTTKLASKASVLHTGRPGCLCELARCVDEEVERTRKESHDARRQEEHETRAEERRARAEHRNLGHKTKFESSDKSETERANTLAPRAVDESNERERAVKNALLSALSAGETARAVECVSALNTSAVLEVEAGTLRFFTLEYLVEALRARERGDRRLNLPEREQSRALLSKFEHVLAHARDFVRRSLADCELCVAERAREDNISTTDARALMKSEERERSLDETKRRVRDIIKAELREYFPAAEFGDESAHGLATNIVIALAEHDALAK